MEGSFELKRPLFQHLYLNVSLGGLWGCIGTTPLVIITYVDVVGIHVPMWYVMGCGESGDELDPFPLVFWQ